jgi:hypothetical protein
MNNSVIQRSNGDFLTTSGKWSEEYPDAIKLGESGAADLVRRQRAAGVEHWDGAYVVVDYGLDSERLEFVD